eukprot:scaffold247372_cov52-Prasinocladus_malaysianus.AAC.1
MERYVYQAVRVFQYSNHPESTIQNWRLGPGGWHTRYRTAATRLMQCCTLGWVLGPLSIPGCCC